MNTLDPTQYIVFNHLFSGPKSRRILLDLLSAVLQPDRDIAEVSSPERTDSNTQENDVLKLLVELGDGTRLTVGMLSTTRPDYRDYALHVLAELYLEAYERVLTYGKLTPVCIILFNALPDPSVPDLHSIFKVGEPRTGVCIEDLITIHLLELSKITDGACMSTAQPDVRRWAKFLGAATDEERIEVSKDHPILGEAYELLKELSGDEEVQRLVKERKERKEGLDEPKRA